MSSKRKADDALEDTTIEPPSQGNSKKAAASTVAVKQENGVAVKVERPVAVKVERPVAVKKEDAAATTATALKTEYPRSNRSVKTEQPNLPEPGRRICPFLDTINRKRLDFDLSKQCSVSLLKQNVYVCLICGGYFQGRGKNTHANSHSFQMGHHVRISNGL